MEKDLPSNIDVIHINKNSELEYEKHKLLQLKMWGVMVFGKDYVLEVDLNNNKSTYVTSLKKIDPRHLQALSNSIQDLLGKEWRLDVKSGKNFLIKNGSVVRQTKVNKAKRKPDRSKKCLK